MSRLNSTLQDEDGPLRGSDATPNDRGMPSSKSNMHAVN